MIGVKGLASKIRGRAYSGLNMASGGGPLWGAGSLMPDLRMSPSSIRGELPRGATIPIDRLPSGGQARVSDPLGSYYNMAQASVSSNKSFLSGVGMGGLSLLGRVGMGAGIGAVSGTIGAGVSGGNYGQGMLSGAAIGAMGGAAMSRGNLGSMYKHMRGREMSRSASKNIVRFGAMGGIPILSGLGGGVMLSGTRGQSKDRGFNSNRGHKISSSGY